MRSLFIALAGLFGLIASAGAARDSAPVSLRPGEQIIVEMDAGGQVTSESGSAASLSEFDQHALIDLVARQNEAQGPNSIAMKGNGPPPPVAQRQIRISFVRIGGRDGQPESLLILENGYTKGLKYRATMVRENRREPTDVCTVVPQLRGYEHWPYQIDRIELTDLRLVPYGEGERPVCE